MPKIAQGDIFWTEVVATHWATPKAWPPIAQSKKPRRASYLAPHVQIFDFRHLAQAKGGAHLFSSKHKIKAFEKYKQSHWSKMAALDRPPPNKIRTPAKRPIARPLTSKMHQAPNTSPPPNSSINGGQK